MTHFFGLLSRRMVLSPVKVHTPAVYKVGKPEEMINKNSMKTGSNKLLDTIHKLFEELHRNIQHV